MSLDLCNVSVNIAGKDIVKHINIHVDNGKFVGLIGLNGTGKSTMLKSIYGINTYTGEIFLDENNLRDLKSNEIAKKMAVLIQENTTDFDFKVKDIVILGRLPYKNFFDNDTVDDYNIVMTSLAYVGMEKFVERYFNSLSGGEKQRVLIARILAQQTDLLVLDEPTNHLDIKNQFQFFELIKGLNMTVFSVLHDLNIAAKFCDYLYVLNNGTIYAHGTPLEVLTEKLLYDVFEMNARIYNEGNGKIHIDYISAI